MEIKIYQINHLRYLDGEKAMARKRRRNKLRLTKQLQFELLGILFIFLSIFGSGASIISDGFIPASLENVFRFFAGIWYFIFPIILLILGFYFVIKRKMPTMLTKRTTGMIIFILGLLLMTHIQIFDRLHINPSESSILKMTFNHFVSYTGGEGVASQLGGGLIGGTLFAVSFYLFSAAGSKIVAVFSMLIGLLFIFNFSIEKSYKKVKNGFQNVRKNAKENRKKRKTAKKVAEKKRMKNSRPQPIPGEVIEPPTDLAPESDNEIDVQYTYKATKSGQLQIHIEEDKPVEVKDEHTIEFTHHDHEPYQLPSIELLNQPLNQSQQKEKSQIKKTVQLLEETFESFGVRAKITKAHVGPAVTKYEVFPEAGVKVSKILNLHDDLALALAAQDIRIEAPIPGKSAVGIEVPNKSIAMVSLREVLDVHAQQHKKLLFALGRDISGNAIIGELNKMPHLLIAGATGSGKSVCINGIITSILMRAKPNEVKMMMIDPKKVELNVYNGIPHLLTPVVTDPKKASMALRKVIIEMDHRYELFSQSGTRNIEGYNAHIKNQKEYQESSLLPYIVVLIDELADLMMVASKDVEDSITRLAQMARAAGIHLIIATQRPSVDVITGVIKANIPSRIAFSVSSQVDSRTILDVGGAEKLLGKGDMLYIPVGMSKPVRVQGAFLSDEEVEGIVNHCIGQQKVDYDEEMMPEEQEESESEDVDDELFDDAVQLIIEMQSASVSMLQRRFRIGYTRAARLIDYMEERGIVGPYEGNKPRIVLIPANKEDEDNTQ